MVDVLQLENVEVVCDRLENISAKFDIIVGRSLFGVILKIRLQHGICLFDAIVANGAISVQGRNKK